MAVITQVEVSAGGCDARMTRAGNRDADGNRRLSPDPKRDHPRLSLPSDDMGSWTLSDVLGYVSICCWLGAQFPSVKHPIVLRS